MSWTEFLTQALPQTFAALIGVLTALLGTRAYEREQRRHLERNESEAKRTTRALAGHRAMLAIEAQRDLAQTLNDVIKDEPDIEKWNVLRVNRDSVPRINLGELEFLITEAKNKNILPCVMKYQQNFDQLITSLENFAGSRRDLEPALLAHSPMIGMYRQELKGAAASIKGSFSVVLGKYNDLQDILLKGLQEQIPDFNPIFRI